MSVKRIWQAFALLALFSGMVHPAAAAGYAGVYEGRFIGGHQGTFALYVRSNNTGVVISYDQTTNTGFSDRRVRIRPNGSFVLNNVGGTGTKVKGKILRSGRVRGAYVTSLGVKGRFVAKRVPGKGPHRRHAGYYAGVFSSDPAACGGLKGSGKATAILAADGRMALYTRITRSSNPALWPVGQQDAGTAKMNRRGLFSGRLASGAGIKGQLKGRLIRGTFSVPGGTCVGNFRLLKRR